MSLSHKVAKKKLDSGLWFNGSPINTNWFHYSFDSRWSSRSELRKVHAGIWDSSGKEASVSSLGGV